MLKILPNSSNVAIFLNVNKNINRKQAILFIYVCTPIIKYIHLNLYLSYPWFQPLMKNVGCK